MDSLQSIENVTGFVVPMVMLLRMERQGEGTKAGALSAGGIFSGLRTGGSLSTLGQMRLSATALQEFKDICRDEFELELSDADAEIHALRVLELFWLLFVDSHPPDSGRDVSHDVDRLP